MEVAQVAPRPVNVNKWFPGPLAVHQPGDSTLGKLEMPSEENKPFPACSLEKLHGEKSF